MNYEDYKVFLETQLEDTDAKVREIQGQLDKILSERRTLQTRLDGVRAWLATKPNSPGVDAGDRAASQTHHETADSGNGATKKSATKTKRVSKNQPIFDAFEAAGPAGLTQQEVLQVALDNGLLTNRDALRALCWSAKQDGRLISIAPGRYAIAPRNEAAVDNSTKGETAASANNQHREGDAGGGT
jgi:hypothetical protein